MHARPSPWPVGVPGPDADASEWQRTWLAPEDHERGEDFIIKYLDVALLCPVVGNAFLPKTALMATSKELRHSMILAVA